MHLYFISPISAEHTNSVTHLHWRGNEPLSWDTSNWPVATGVVKVIRWRNCYYCVCYFKKSDCPGWGRTVEHCCTAIQNNTDIIFISSQSFYLHWPFQKRWCVRNTVQVAWALLLTDELWLLCLPCGSYPLRPAPSLTWNLLSVLQVCFMRGYVTTQIFKEFR